MSIFGACDPCVLNPPGCVNGTCVEYIGNCDCEAGYDGRLCELEIDECDPDPCQNGGTCTDLLADYECACIDDYIGKNCHIEPCEAPDCDPYTTVTAGRLDPTGCDTYIGAHPVNPGQLLCCSAPSSGSAPVCAIGDTPDIPCVVEFEFCDDGTAMKAWSPQPATGYPGHTASTSGTWSVDPDTGELEIITTASAMGGALLTVTTETYYPAFTYDDGTKLDLNSSAVVTINTGGFGDYHSVGTNLTDIGGLWSALLDAEMNTALTVTPAGYESTYLREVECTPPLGMVCLVTPQSEQQFTSGTITQPIELYITSTGDMVYQTDAARVLVFERQADICDTIDCGAHGSCDDGVCVCTDGYIGELCDAPGPCTGINCGENGTCVEGDCECDPGYEGASCEVDIDECESSPCLNGGSCAQGVPGTYECTCIDGFTGDDCEICPTDADGDGYGAPASGLCTHPQLDCDDIHATVYPGAPELCDGLDNQCPLDPGHGSTDEGYTHCGNMAAIPGDCFDMGDTFAEGWPDELPVHNVCLSAFEMDIHEITNAEYAECVADSICTPPLNLGSYDRDTYYGDDYFDNYPVIWMEWHQVNEYCAWAGKRLPTEAEWEYAARGGLAGQRYPWGNTITSADANYDFNVGDTTPVQSYPPNGYGLYDMAGNVWEWIADWFNESYYSVSPADDPTGPATGMAPVKRGGSFDHSTFGLRVANRCDFCHGDRHANNLGGRCAR